MRYSQVLGKTQFGDQLKGSQFISHQLLVKGGFIAESTAGRYFFLPLGWRVHEKIKAVIKDEMDTAGAQEMITPVLHPIELWQETNRTSSVGFELMSISDQRGARFALGGTAEEMFVDVVRKLNLTYKDLPFNVYQFSTKFRDEKRARGGLLRVREFVMKDAYSFHASADDFKQEYDKMAAAYARIFSRVGLEAQMVAADNGYIGGEYCHEFQVESEIGEGKFFVSEDGAYVAHEDIAAFKREPVNLDEALKPLETIEQPEWVQTMEDNIKHYQLPKSHFLKNVVYKNVGSGEIIIAVIRGDLEVNKVKLEHVVDAVGQLVEATDEDLIALGTKRGYVHSWGHEGARYIGDLSLESAHNFIGGHKTETTDTKNVNYRRDFTCEKLADIALAQEGYVTESGSRLIAKRGIEVGNIFQLGYHYSTKMKNAAFVDKDGKTKPFYMGCYGIGLGRTLATIVEKHHDDKGIVWPKAVAPYLVHLISLKGAEERGQEVYDQLLAQGIEVLWDDRAESPGKKFADADLLGMPYRLVVSPRTGENLEWKARTSEKAEVISWEEVLKRLREV